MKNIGRFSGLEQSYIRKMTQECIKVDGINLGQGLCILPTPQVIIDAAAKAMHLNFNHYSHAEGELVLRLKIAEKLDVKNGISADPESEILVTNGATGGFIGTITALLSPGDGVLLIEPFYGYHKNCCTAAGLDIQFVQNQKPDAKINEVNLSQSIKQNTKAIVICTPGNPSGKMFSRTELEAVASFAEKHDLLVITDEIYEYITYGDTNHISPASIDKLKYRTITIMGFSKTFNITGWRLGYLTGPKDLVQKIKIINDIYYICPPVPLQYGAVEGFNLGEDYFSSLQQDFKQKRDMLCESLDDVGLTPNIPQGAYYVLSDVSSLGFDSSVDASMEILKRTKIATVPGTEFYSSSVGERYVRFCFSPELKSIQLACKKLRQIKNSPRRTG